jgi:hypothetical protein
MGKPDIVAPGAESKPQPFLLELVPESVSPYLELIRFHKVWDLYNKSEHDGTDYTIAYRYTSHVLAPRYATLRVHIDHCSTLYS